MSGRSIATNGLSSFTAYAIDTTPQQVYEDLAGTPECLADFIQAWVQSGEGIRECIGEFEVFLVAVVSIIDYWSTNRHILDYVTDEEERVDGVGEVIERRVESILGKQGLDHPILDPHYFARRTFRWQHPYRDDE